MVGDLPVKTYDGCHCGLIHTIQYSTYNCSEYFTKPIGDFICTVRRKEC